MMKIHEEIALLEKRADRLEKELQDFKMQIANLKQRETESNLPNERLLLTLEPDARKRTIVKKAVSKGLLRWNERGRLEGNMRSKVLVAYFVGRLWADDEAHPCSVTHEMIWVFGGMFPNKLVTSLFEETGLRDLRKSRNHMPVPMHHEIVDELF